MQDKAQRRAEGPPRRRREGRGRASSASSASSRSPKLLPHDHIVEVLDFQPTEDESFALVMEFLDGEELRIMLKREKDLAPERARAHARARSRSGSTRRTRRSSCTAISSPTTCSSAARARATSSRSSDFGSVKDKNKDAKKLTVLGTTIGSPFYMAPEQAQGLETLDARADVWALAAIAYECLTGTRAVQGQQRAEHPARDPHQGSHAADAKRAKAAPMPIPPASIDVIEVALAKNPNIQDEECRRARRRDRSRVRAHRRSPRWADDARERARASRFDGPLPRTPCGEGGGGRQPGRSRLPLRRREHDRASAAGWTRPFARRLAPTARRRRARDGRPQGPRRTGSCPRSSVALVVLVGVVGMVLLLR